MAETGVTFVIDRKTKRVEIYGIDVHSAGKLGYCLARAQHRGEMSGDWHLYYYEQQKDGIPLIGLSTYYWVNQIIDEIEKENVGEDRIAKSENEIMYSMLDKRLRRVSKLIQNEKEYSFGYVDGWTDAWFWALGGGLKRADHVRLQNAVLELERQSCRKEGER
jgi:hypothetical protein